MENKKLPVGIDSFETGADAALFDGLEINVIRHGFSDEKMAFEKRVERLTCLKTDIRSICAVKRSAPWT